MRINELIKLLYEINKIQRNKWQKVHFQYFRRAQLENQMHVLDDWI